MRTTIIRDEYARNARLVCSGDPEVGVVNYLRVHRTEAEARARVQHCAYFTDPVQTAGLTMGGENAAYEYAFDFAPDGPDQEPRLFRIALRPNADALQYVLPSLQDRWGAPRISETPIENGFGAVFPQRTYLCRRGGGQSRSYRQADHSTECRSSMS